MPDKQVHPIGTEPAPADYPIPDSAELLIKGVYATFDGSNANGDFRPLVRIISDAGTTVIEAVSDTTVAAGGSADASWFPHVGAAAAAAPSGSVLAYAQGVSDFAGGDPVQNVAAGAHANGTHANVTTTDASRLSWSTNVNTNDTLTLHGPGTFLVWAHTLWQFTDPALTSQIMNTFIGGFRHGPWAPLPNQSFVPSDGIANMQDYDVLHASGGGGIASVLHQNGTAFSAGVNVQFMTAVFLGTG